MAWRTNEDDVRGIVNNDPNIAILPFIKAADVLVDYVSSQDSNSLLNANALEQIELWLAAHFYAIRDPQPAEGMVGGRDGASAVFQGKTDMRLESTQWGQQAMLLDLTGTLAQLQRTKRRVSMSWLGLAPSEQTDYVDRD